MNNRPFYARSASRHVEMSSCAPGDMGRVDGPQIDMGMGRRRVTGNDLFLFRALVSRNEQTIDDLTDLHPADERTLARYAAQTRPKFVTEGLVDRISGRLNDWASRGARRVYQLFARRRGDESRAA